MEESAKRRERLKAMRTKASQAAVYNDANNCTVSHGLSNPLIETAAADPGQVESCAPQRFDYYTDPMSAFSGNKKKSKVSNQTSEDYFTLSRPRSTEISSPALQAQINYSLDQRVYQAQGISHNSGPHGMPSPFGTQPRTPPGVLNAAGGTSSYCFSSNSPRVGNFPIPAFGQEGSPSFDSGQGRGHWFNNGPDLGLGCGGSPSFGQGGSPSFTPGQGRGHWSSNSPGPGSGRGGSPSFNSGQGRVQWFGNSPSQGSGRGGSPGFNSGRGRGRQLGNNTSPGSGWRSGRGRGSPNHVSVELRPDLYYNKAMVEDPWKFLKPVIWKREYPQFNDPRLLKILASNIY